MDNISRIALGTVQFGMDYGIANQLGRINEPEVFEILDQASSKGIDTVDTAFAYGDSQKVIGQYLKENNQKFNIVTKVSSGIKKTCQEQIEESLKVVQVGFFYGCLIHSFKIFKEDNNVLKDLIDLKKQGLISKIGFSLYDPKELQQLLDDKVEFDLVQVPYSVFDTRFETFFESLKNKGIEIHCRSVFLQGLPFLDLENFPEYLLPARNALAALDAISNESGIPKSAICLNFALMNQYVDRVVIGVDSLEQFRGNVDNIKFFDQTKNILSDLKKISINDDFIVMPNKWGNS